MYQFKLPKLNNSLNDWNPTSLIKEMLVFNHLFLCEENVDVEYNYSCNAYMLELYPDTRLNVAAGSLQKRQEQFDNIVKQVPLIFAEHKVEQNGTFRWWQHHSCYKGMTLAEPCLRGVKFFIYC